MVANEKKSEAGLDGLSPKTSESSSTRDGVNSLATKSGDRGVPFSLKSKRVFFKRIVLCVGSVRLKDFKKSRVSCRLLSSFAKNWALIKEKIRWKRGWLEGAE
jgi:hypothetical protein